MDITTPGTGVDTPTGVAGMDPVGAGAVGTVQDMAGAAGMVLVGAGVAGTVQDMAGAILITVMADMVTTEADEDTTDQEVLMPQVRIAEGPI